MSRTNVSRWAPRLAALDANLLVALDALLQDVSVTNAARRIGVTQSAMSQTLSRLRAQFDDPLLVRAGRRMELTPFASRIQARLRGAMGELEAVVADRARFEPRTESRRFVVAAVDYVAMMVVPPLQRALPKKAPRADLAVHTLDAQSIEDHLERGLIDLYLGVLGSTERGLRAEALFSESLSVVVRRGHPLAKGRLSAPAYAAAAHVHVSPRRDPRSLVDRALREVGLERRVAIEVPYFGLVPELLAGSDLVATMPGRVAQAFAARHALVLRPVPIQLPTIEIGMAWHPAFEREPRSIWLRDLVRAVVGGAERRDAERACDRRRLRGGRANEAALRGEAGGPVPEQFGHQYRAADTVVGEVRHRRPERDRRRAELGLTTGVTRR